MRELLVPDKNKQLVCKLEKRKPKVVQAEFRDMFNELREKNEKLISIELCSNRFVDFDKLLEIKPTFCSVTWHWKSNDRYNEPKAIHEIPAIVLAKHLLDIGLQVLLHLPGRNLNFEQAKSVLDEVKRIGVRNLFVIRGDGGAVSGKERAFPYAKDLVVFIRENFGDYFSIGVAGYPEVVERDDSSQEFLYLKQKVDAGADFIITQAIFHLPPFEMFFKRCRLLGITIPILPGVFIFQSYNGLNNMSLLCSIKIPQEIKDITCKINKDPERVKNYSMHLFKNLFLNLYQSRNEVFCIHIFSLNNLGSVRKMYEMIGFFGISIDRPLRSNVYCN